MSGNATHDLSLSSPAAMSVWGWLRRRGTTSLQEGLGDPKEKARKWMKEWKWMSHCDSSYMLRYSLQYSFPFIAKFIWGFKLNGVREGDRKEGGGAHSRGIASNLYLVKPLIKFLLHYPMVFPSTGNAERWSSCVHMRTQNPSVSIYVSI